MNNIHKIIEELSNSFTKYDNMFRDQIFTDIVQHRLKVSTKNYNDELHKMEQGLDSIKFSRVVNTLHRIQKESNKEDIKREMKENK